MNKRLSSALVAAVVAVGMSIPAAGLAAGKGHHYAYGKTRPCPTHKHSGKHKGTKGKRKGSSKGKKCYRNTSSTTTTSTSTSTT